MSDVSAILAAAAGGDHQAAEKLLPLVYDELRKLASARLARERPGQTLQATALVHEAYLRLLGNGKSSGSSGEQVVAFASRGHFFAAAAEAMRRILVEQARRRLREKHGGGRERLNLDEVQLAAPERPEELVALDEALERLTAEDAVSAALVKLRFFAGFTIPEAAELLGISPRQADFLWAFARAWLRREVRDKDGA